MNRRESDLVLVPDPATLTVLPWRPSRGRVVRFFCDVRRPDGTPFEGDGRHLLKEAIRKAETMGLAPMIGAECEFYLFELDEHGQPTMNPHDQAGYLDIAPLDKGENVRREICLTLEEMGIEPVSSHHQQGPGQNEVSFRHHNALRCADNVVHFNSVVKTIANRNGLCASFMPKPLLGQSGSSLHINVSMLRGGQNIFSEKSPDYETARCFIAGVLNRVKEMTLFLNPITNSYKRLGEYEAPGYISWSQKNISQLIRIPITATEEEARMELRSPDMSCNPYVAFALVLYAGLEGIEKGLPLPPPLDYDVAEELERKDAEMLPSTLKEAIGCAENSEFLKSVLPEKIFKHYVRTKKAQSEQYDQSMDKEQLERDLYFLRV